MPVKITAPKAWLEIAKKDLDRIHDGIQTNLKARKRREFILVMACLIALLYIYPAQSFETNPQIEIPSISFKISIRDAAVVFPTVLAAIYLIFVASVISHARLSERQVIIRERLNKYVKTGVIPDRVTFRKPFIYSTPFYYIFLPSPLHSIIWITSTSGLFAKVIVDAFVGIVFTVLPYATIIFVIWRVSNTVHSTVLLLWNLLCTSVMLFSLLGTILTLIRQRQRSIVIHSDI